MKKVCIGLVLLFAMSSGASFAADRLPVYVSILPQQYFLEKIGGDLVDVSVMVLPGGSPATYEPTPKQMARLARAKGYFSIGVPFERTWLDRITAANRTMEIIHTDAGVKKLPMAAHHHEEEHGEHRGDMHHDEAMYEEHDELHDETMHEEHGQILDPHIWLSPELVRTIAINSCEGLVRLDPANRAAYEKNLKMFLAELAELDGEIKKKLADVPHDKRTFMVFHPSWGYFAERYHLNQIAIESEGKSPGPRELGEIVEHGRELGVSVVFVQPQFSKRSAKVIASEIGAQVLPLDPLNKDWETNMRNAANAFREALR